MIRLLSKIFGPDETSKDIDLTCALCVGSNKKLVTYWPDR